MSFLFFWLLHCTFYSKKYVCKLEKERVVAVIVSFILSVFCLLFGSQIIHEYYYGTFGKIASFLIIFAGSWIVLERIIEILYAKEGTVYLPSDKTEASKGVFWKYVGLLLICWLPFYLANYPGVVTIDSATQIVQAAFRNYSNHHPVMQTWIIRGIMTLVSAFTTDYNVYVACYVVLQCIAIAMIYAFSVKTLNEIGVKKSYRIVTLLFFALMPYNIMMSINMWKDTLFSTGFLLMLVSFWRLHAFNRRIDLIELFIGSFIVCMFRNNGWYAFLATLPFAIIILWKKRKDACIVLAGILALVVLIRGPVFKMNNISQPDIAESLSIPIQQIANVIAQGGELTDSEYSLLSEIVDLEEVAKSYDSRISDPVKTLIVLGGKSYLIKERKTDFFKLWINVGKRYPGFYLQAFVEQTEGYYNPDIQRWQYTSGICKTDVPITSEPLLPQGICKVLSFYVSDWLYSIPVLGMLKSIGFYVWVMFILCGLCIAKKKFHLLTLFVPLIAYWGTLIVATPVYAEFRYIYCLFVSMPIIIAASFLKKNDAAIYN